MTLELDHAPPWLLSWTDPDAAPDGLPDPVAWNLAGMLRAWADYPRGMDFLLPDSPNRRWKALQTALLRAAAPALDNVVAGTRVLDLACGIGRFLAPYRTLGADVVGLDICRPSLEAADRHLGRLSGTGSSRLILADLADATSWPKALGDAQFDLALLIELLCYLPDPRATLRALVPHLAPGATVVASVEAWPGALLADFSGLTMADLPEASRTHILSNPGERWVQTSARGELSAMLADAGLQVLSEEGLCYLPDGPFLALVDPDRGDLADEQAAVAEIEEMLRRDPHLAPLPRAWVAVARWEGP